MCDKQEENNVPIELPSKGQETDVKPIKVKT